MSEIGKNALSPTSYIALINETKTSYTFGQQGEKLMWNFQEVGLSWLIAHWLFMVVFWGLLIIIGMKFLSSLGLQSSAAKPYQNAVELLNNRFAMGEISREEYRSLKADLEE